MCGRRCPEVSAGDFFKQLASMFNVTAAEIVFEVATTTCFVAGGERAVAARLRIISSPSLLRRDHEAFSHDGAS